MEGARLTMSELLLSISKHDGKDLGYFRDNLNELSHYFRSNYNSNLAISHCKMIVMKSDLRPNEGKAYCPICDLVEDLRDEMDGKNETT